MLPVTTFTCPRELEIPGSRHDNDNIDITRIKILPTEDEIRCEQAEFLPSTCLEQPHFLSGVDRLLDTHFRLLRYDVFGELKVAVGGLLSAFEKDANIAKNPQAFLDNLHSYVYSGACVTYIAFDKSRGLEAQLSFLQPAQVRKKSAAERRKWWDDSRRLEEGSLLCFLVFEDSKSSLLFFTVSHKKSDQNDPHGLSFGEKARITVKLASGGDKNQLTKLMQLYRRLKELSKCWILEFSGVLLPTFAPILENLQQMQKLSRLPFHQWIAPDSIEKVETENLPSIHVPPPVYARSPGFKFDLKPILNDSNMLFLEPASETNFEIQHELQRRSNLDKGQCEDLVAALTREYALIQGPPGTGKSFLGIQIMRILVHNSKNAGLGPIIVV